MSLENVGYSKRGVIDWAKLAKGIADQTSQIGIDARKADIEYDKILDDTNKFLNKPIASDISTLNSAVLSGANTGRNFMKSLKDKLYAKEITPYEYKLAATNLVENWQLFADQVNNVDERWNLYQQRQQGVDGQLPAGSNSEAFLMEQYANMADLSNKEWVIGNDGSIALKGKDDGKIYDFRVISKPENMAINRVSVPDLVNDSIKDWKSTDLWKSLGMEGYQNITSIKNQDDYKFMKANVSTALTSNPRIAVSILVDNGVISAANYYDADKEAEADANKKLAIKEAEEKWKQVNPNKEFPADLKRQIELSFVKFGFNERGEYVPMLTDEQMQAAIDRVDMEIDTQIETSIQGAPRQVNMNTGAPGSSAGGGTSNYATYASINQAWNESNMDILRNMNPEYNFKWDSKKKQVHVYKIEYVNQPRGEAKKEERYISSAGSARELSRYFWKESTKDQAEEKFDLEKQAYIDAGNVVDKSGQAKNPNDGASNSGGNAR